MKMIKSNFSVNKTQWKMFKWVVSKEPSRMFTTFSRRETMKNHSISWSQAEVSQPGRSLCYHLSLRDRGHRLHTSHWLGASLLNFLRKSQLCLDRTLKGWIGTHHNLHRWSQAEYLKPQSSQQPVQSHLLDQDRKLLRSALLSQRRKMAPFSNK